MVEVLALIGAWTVFYLLFKLWPKEDKQKRLNRIDRDITKRSIERYNKNLEELNDKALTEAAKKQSDTFFSLCDEIEELEQLIKQQEKRLNNLK